MSQQCKKDLRAAISTLYSILALLIAAMVLLFIAVMVNSNIWTFLATWIWIGAALFSVAAAFALFDNMYQLKSRNIKNCLVPKCGETYYQRYTSSRNSYRVYNRWVIGAITAAFFASFFPFSVAFFVAIVMLSLGPLIAFTNWMINALRGMLKCFK